MPSARYRSASANRRSVQMAAVEVRVGPADLLLHAARDRDLQRPAQLPRPRPARGHRGASFGVERVALYLEHAQCLGNRLRLLGQLDRGRRGRRRASAESRDWRTPRPVRRSARVVRAWRARTRRRPPPHDRGTGATSCARAGASCRPRAAGRPPRATTPAPCPRASAASCHRSISDSSYGQPFVESGVRRRIRAGREPQRALVLRRRLAVRGQFSRPQRRARSMPQHRRAISRRPQRGTPCGHRRHSRRRAARRGCGRG